MAPGGWRHCRTGWPRPRRSARSWRASRRPGRNLSRSCSGWRSRPPGTSMSSAPASRSMSFFSCDCVSGMTMTDLRPSALPTSARPMPVLPAVPSTTMPPGCSAPRCIASLMMNRAARSFTDWPGFMNSALPRMVQPVISEARFSLISGVLPIASRTFWRMVMLAASLGNAHRLTPARRVESGAASTRRSAMRRISRSHGADRTAEPKPHASSKSKVTSGEVGRDWQASTKPFSISQGSSE